MNKIDLTKGNILNNLIKFAIPYLISCFLQTFYGLADLYIVGQYNNADMITAVSIGSQVMHMVTVIIVGLAMGTTVLVSRYVGAKDSKRVGRTMGNSAVVFVIFAFIVTCGTLLSVNQIIGVLEVPDAAISGTKSYLTICFAGIIFITAYNVLCSILRGLGDSKTPMYFVAVAGVLNIGLDYVLVGYAGMGAAGAAAATVISQAVSVIMALIYSVMRIPEIRLRRTDLKYDKKIYGELLRIGIPVAVQDGFIQIAFLVITVIANMRGLEAAAAVGIVEKLISFMFLVPSAMLSAVSTITAANIGSGSHERGKKTLWYGISICIIVGVLFTIICNIFSEEILRIFAREEDIVIIMGGQYLRAYVFDCIAAGIHFCFSGYFCAYGRSWISFVHNVISIVTVRIPGAYLAWKMFPDTLYPMGLAAPLGSALSAVICTTLYLIMLSAGQYGSIEE